MLGTVLAWVLLLLLLLYCEAAIVVAYDTAVEMDSRNCLEMGPPRHELDRNSLDSDADNGTGWHRRRISQVPRACP